MDNRLPSAALELGQAATDAFTALGDIDLARRAQKDRALRNQAADTLDKLGLADIDARLDIEATAAAAQLARAAGAVALPYPVVPALLAAAGAGWSVVVDDFAEPIRIEHGDLDLDWQAITLDGRRRSVDRLEPVTRQRLAPFLAVGQLGRSDADAGADPGNATLALILDAWWLLGAIEKALELAVQHTSDRRQFGEPLSHFQAVQFMITDCIVATRSLDELAKYTTWAWHANPADRRADALGLRVVALESVHRVFLNAHQAHGAIGFSDEHDLSVLHRCVQGHVRLPFDYERTSELLLEAVDATGFESIFGRFESAEVAR